MRKGIAALATASALLVAPTGARAQDELSTSDHLQSRRYVAAGDRAYVMGFEDGRFGAQGWHITGEMGGVWSQPLKLVDGVWFGVQDQWVGQATRFTSGWGSTRMDLPSVDGLQLSRTDFAPDGRRAALIGLRIDNPGAARRVAVKVDAHSEVMSHYPWGWTTPSAGDFNAQDTGEFSAGALRFRDAGTPASGPHDWVALVGSKPAPASGTTGPGHWGPQDPPQVCTDAAFTCDDGPYGKGTGGQLTYDLSLPAGGTRWLWVAVAGSDRGAATAQRDLDAALAAPARELAAKQAQRQRWSRYTQLSLPGDQRLAEGIDWGKQNLLDLTQRAGDLKVRDVNEGKAYPPPLGTVPQARWIGAGYPDYPWLFATDGEYTAFAAVTVGQFGAIEDHARALRDVSQIINGNSGKVAHEVVADGSVYFGALEHNGNTDETAKFPSMVALIWRWTGDNAFRDEMYGFARRNLRYVLGRLDADHDGWPEGLGNVERTGMGPEKLDNAVYTLRGLFDLADMARSKGDGATYAWARNQGRNLLRRFEGTWWMPAVSQYADSLQDPGNRQVWQKHWIGQTPMEAELTLDGRAWPGLAALPHGTAALAAREDAGCFSGARPYNRGLFHTACGGGPEGKGEQVIYSLGNAIQAVGDGNYGRLGPEQQKRYTDANVEAMFGEPYQGTNHTAGTPDEQPGALPEVLPSPDFDPAGPQDANMERGTRSRSMVMQAWGNYGTMWPVVHQQLGVRPDMGRAALEVVPQPPPHDPAIAARNIRMGRGALALVSARRDGTRYTTTVETGSAGVRTLRIGATLPSASHPLTVLLDGRRARAQRRTTNRGLEVTVRTGGGRHVLEVIASG